MSDEPVVLINLLQVRPPKQDALVALLKQNTQAVVGTLRGWKTTRLIARAAPVSSSTPSGRPRQPSRQCAAIRA
jgi:hypothetical protein